MLFKSPSRVQRVLSCPYCTMLPFFVLLHMLQYETHALYAYGTYSTACTDYKRTNIDLRASPFFSGRKLANLLGPKLSKTNESHRINSAELFRSTKTYLIREYLRPCLSEVSFFDRKKCRGKETSDLIGCQFKTSNLIGHHWRWRHLFRHDLSDWVFYFQLFFRSKKKKNTAPPHFYAIDQDKSAAILIRSNPFVLHHFGRGEFARCLSNEERGIREAVVVHL